MNGVFHNVSDLFIGDVVAKPMRNFIFCRWVLISLSCVCALCHSAIAEEPTGSKPKQFIYVLRPVPRLYADSAWTKEDNMALDRHFARFKHAIETGELILAGRTGEP